MCILLRQLMLQLVYPQQQRLTSEQSEQPAVNKFVQMTIINMEIKLKLALWLSL